MADLRTELLAIREQYGELTPARVVEAASEPLHPLHGRFEWDNDAAAHKYRLDQARQLIRVVRQAYVDAKGNESRVRAFHSMPTGDGMAYQPLDEIVKDDIASAVLLRQMERDWRQLKARYEHLAEFRALVVADVAQDAAA